MLASGTHAILLVPLALCLVACSGTDPESDAQIAMFTGRIDTADAVVGLAVANNGDLDAYLCGGDSTFETHSRWFSGSLAANKASLESDSFRLDLSLRGDLAEFTLTTPDGIPHASVLHRAAPGNHSALYESNVAAACRWGVVVLDDGKSNEEPAVYGTWCDQIASIDPSLPDQPISIYAQVTPVRPIDFSKHVLPVLVTTPAGEERRDVHRARVHRASP